MDFTGTRRSGREDERSATAQLFKEIADAIIAKVHPEIRFEPLTGREVEPNRADLVKNWRLGGYYLASFLVPTRKRRAPVELECFIEGMRMRKNEYEAEIVGDGQVSVETFDVDASERLEGRAEKYLRLATHENTPVNEARAAAFALAKMIASSELALLSWDRVRHFAKRFAQMEDLFEMIRAENPFLFLYGARDQQNPRH